MADHGATLPLMLFFGVLLLAQSLLAAVPLAVVFTIRATR